MFIIISYFLGPPKPCKDVLDIGIVLDSSNSITAAPFAQAKDFVSRLASRMEVSPRGTHMGIVVYSYQGHTVYKFTDQQNLADVQRAINGISYLAGGTRTDRAMTNAAEDLFGWVDSGDRPEKPNVLLVLTDGDTNHGSEPYPTVKAPLKVLTVLGIWQLFPNQ